MRASGRLALAFALAACSSPSPSDEGTEQVQVHTPPDPCPHLYVYRHGECVVREVYVPGGAFVMGRGWCEDPQPQSAPLSECVLRDQPQTVSVSPFWVDVAPLLHQRFPCLPGQVACSMAHPGSTWPGDNRPSFSAAEALNVPDGDVTRISWCEDEGKRLIREDEWEFLVTAGGTRLYPWGDQPPSCNFARWDPSCPLPPGTPPNGDWQRVTPWIAVDAYPPSPEGVYGLIDLYPHLVAPSPHVVYGDSYSPVPFTRLYPNPPQCQPDGQPDPAYCAVAPQRCKDHPGKPCEEHAWAVRGGRVGGEHSQLLRSAQALRGPARSLSVQGNLMYARCARDAR